MKAVPIKRAIALATMLRPAWRSEAIEEQEVLAYHDILSSFTKGRDLVKMTEPTHADLHVLRILLAAELSRKAGDPRLPLVMLLVRRHEQLMTALRVQPLLDEVPSIAVEWEKAQPRAKAENTITGMDLQTAVTGALHGPTVFMTGSSLMRRVCPKTDKPCECSLTEKCPREGRCVAGELCEAEDCKGAGRCVR